MCGEEKDGLPVKDDAMIGTIRWIKRNITKSEKNYRLVVCKEDFLKYKKRRDSYERKQILYVAIGIVFLIALAVASRGSIGAIIVGLVITLFMLLLAQLSYMPAVEMPKAAQTSKK